MAIGKCDFCGVVAEIVDDDTEYTHCAYCAAISKHVNYIANPNMIDQLRALCAIANVFEKRTAPDKGIMVHTPEILDNQWMNVCVPNEDTNFITIPGEDKKKTKRGRPRRKS